MPISPSTPKTLVLTTGKQETITHVGCNRFGFDSTVDIETLRSLYLVGNCISQVGCLKLMPCLQSPAYIKEGGDVKVSLDAPQKDFSTETTYDHNTNTIQYSTVNKFPPVKLLPNHERKRILGKYQIVMSGR